MVYDLIRDYCRCRAGVAGQEEERRKGEGARAATREYVTKLTDYARLVWWISGVKGGPKQVPACC